MLSSLRGFLCWSVRFRRESPGNIQPSVFLPCLSVCQLTQHESLVALFDNRTWCREGVAEEFDYISHHHHHAWKHPQVNVFITLILFIIMKVVLQTHLVHRENMQGPKPLLMVWMLSVSVLDVRCGHDHARSMWGLHASFSYRWVWCPYLMWSISSSCSG